jgi:hypothetical protein
MTINELVYKVYYILGGNCYREQLATTIGGALNLHMHTSGVKHMQRVTKLKINTSSLFPQEKLMIRVLPFVFEPSKNRPCIDEWREYERYI